MTSGPIQSIIARHWFGRGRPSMADPLQRVRFQQLTTHLHGLGPRSVGEFLEEIITAWPVPAGDVLERLERYAGLDPDIVRTVGVDRFPSPPLYGLAEEDGNATAVAAE